MAGTSGLDFLIGFMVSLLSSIMNAAGLNLLKLDHVRNSARPIELQRNECARPLWHIGLGLYILSQLAGSTIALNFLKTQWVAPLGSIALIFNFIFAKILVGTRITKKDVYGTIIVMASVIWIVVFGAMNDGGDIEDKLTLADLKLLFSRFVFILYFSILNIITFGFLFLGMYAYWAISIDDDASGQIRKRMKKRLTNLLGTNRFARASGLSFDDLVDDDHERGHGGGAGSMGNTGGGDGETAEQKDLRLKKVVAMIMAGCGGMLASQTLLLAKSGVKLITSTFSGNNQFTDYLSYFILFVLVVTAVLQVYCLNTGLKLYDSVLVVPLFYGFYTAFGLINSVIYLDQLKLYEPWVLLLVLAGIAALIYGVKMLSAPKPDPTLDEAMSSLDSRGRRRYNDDDDDEDDDDEMMMEETRRGGSGGTANGGSGHAGGDLERSMSRSSKFSLAKSGMPLVSSADSSNSITTSSTTTHGMGMDDQEVLTRSASKAQNKAGGRRSSGGIDTTKHEGTRGSKFANILKFGKNKGGAKHMHNSHPSIDTKPTKSRGGMTYLDENGSSKNGLRRNSMFSKASVNSDPFKTPKDSQSLSGELSGELDSTHAGTTHHKATILDQDNLYEEPTHVLIDTASEDEGGDEDRRMRGQAALTTAAAIMATQQQQKKQALDQDPLAKLDTGVGACKLPQQQQQQQQSPPSSTPPPRPLSLISNPFRTTFETGIDPSSPISPLMSPSQLKAHLTAAAAASKSPLKPSPMHQSQDNMPSSASASPGSGRPASVRWSTGNHMTMDKTFEDLNPFKVLRSNSHHYHHHTTSEGRRGSLMSDSSFFSDPNSPRQHHPTTFSPGVPLSFSPSSSTSPQSPQETHSSSTSTIGAVTKQATKSSEHSHRRQESFTGLPSSFDVPGRKKRHSMLFGVPGEGPHSPSSAAAQSPRPSGETTPAATGSSSPSSSSSTPSTSSPSQHRRAMSIGSRSASASSLTGHTLPASCQSVSSTQPLSSATTTVVTGRAGDRTSASHMYRDHFFTGVPGSPSTETAH
ncbi:hypothetical protein BGW42_007333 [Actinomortierella wolfii]|nr:hypothetical protein BGW42_007333 [Actinomortierella wolfii]